MTIHNSIKRAVNRIVCSQTLYLSLHGESSMRKEIKIEGNLLAARVISRDGYRKLAFFFSRFALMHFSCARLIPRRRGNTSKEKTINWLELKCNLVLHLTVSKVPGWQPLLICPLRSEARFCRHYKGTKKTVTSCTITLFMPLRISSDRISSLV